MTIEITMPALSPTMTDGTLAKWTVKEGDKIKPGMVIAEIETDKASMEVEAVDGGVIGRILVNAGSDNVKVGSVIALLLESGEKPEDLAKYEVRTAAPKLPVVESDSKTKTPDVQLSVEKSGDSILNDRVFASPLAKRIASDKNIDLGKISGTGPNNRIVKADLENAISGSVVDTPSYGSVGKTINSHPSLESKSIPHTSMRKAIASRLTESKQKSPHFYLSTDCSMSELLLMRKKMNENYNKHLGEGAVNISVNDLFIKASAVALKANPEINVSWSADSIVMHGSVDISIAVSIPGGLITPIVKNADRIGLLELSSAAKSLIKKAREGLLAPSEFQGGTFSVSNLGMYNIKEFYPIINPPQSAILSIGSTSKRPVVKENGEIIADDVCTIGLSVDHRAIDGVAAAKFLQFIKQVIENPIMLSL